MHCPVEKSVLQSHQEGASEIFICDICHGFWFSREQLAIFLKCAKTPTLSKARRALSPIVPVVDQRKCPSCENKPLTARVIDGVEVDICQVCHGIWLDSGELELIITRYRKRKNRTNLADGLDVPIDIFTDTELVGDLANLIGGAFDRSADWAGDAASALLEFLGEALGAIDF